MKRIALVLAAVAALSACNDPVVETPTPQPTPTTTTEPNAPIPTSS